MVVELSDQMNKPIFETRDAFINDSPEAVLILVSRFSENLNKLDQLTGNVI